MPTDARRPGESTNQFLYRLIFGHEAAETLPATPTQVGAEPADAATLNAQHDALKAAEHPEEDRP